ncbi:MAG: histidine kinase, partial [Lysobacteraceae bacterium]
MSLRAKLLLLALSTLVLPVAGWLLVRQLEVLLREGQAQVQLASAQMLARAVTMQGDVFPVAGPALFVQAADAPLVLDGYDLDWRSQDLLDHGIAPGLRLALARSEGQLHLLATVRDASRVRADAHWPQAASADHLLLVIEDERGLHRLRLASAAPGPLISVPLEGEGGPRLRGEWQEDAQGYRIELRFPPGYLPQRLGLDVVDFSDPALPPQRFGSGAELDEGRWTVQTAPPGLQLLLAQLLPEGVQATLTQADGWVLA